MGAVIGAQRTPNCPLEYDPLTESRAAINIKALTYSEKINISSTE